MEKKYGRRVDAAWKRNGLTAMFAAAILLAFSGAASGCARAEKREITPGQPSEAVTESSFEVSAEEILEQGQSAVITREQVEFTQKVLMMSADMTEEKAWQEALKRCRERESLYAAAADEKIRVTEAEIQSYREEEKRLFLEQAETFQPILDLYGSEEAFWEHEQREAEKNCAVQKYVESKRAEYQQSIEDQEEKEPGSLKRQKGWNAYFEELKASLVEEQQFRRAE